MGFESSRVARRRLASLAATNDRVQEALSPSSFPGLAAGDTGVFPALMAEPLADMPESASRRPERAADRSAISATNGPVPSALVHSLR